MSCLRYETWICSCSRHWGVSALALLSKQKTVIEVLIHSHPGLVRAAYCVRRRRREVDTQMGSLLLQLAADGTRKVSSNPWWPIAVRCRLTCMFRLTDASMDKVLGDGFNSAKLRALASTSGQQSS
jgi:hypothetical protein